MPWLRFPARVVRISSNSSHALQDGGSEPSKREPSKSDSALHLVHTIFSNPPWSWIVFGQGPLELSGIFVRSGSRDVSIPSTFCV